MIVKQPKYKRGLEQRLHGAVALTRVAPDVETLGAGRVRKIKIPQDDLVLSPQPPTHHLTSSHWQKPLSDTSSSFQPWHPSANNFNKKSRVTFQISQHAPHPASEAPSRTAQEELMSSASYSLVHRSHSTRQLPPRGVLIAGGAARSRNLQGGKIQYGSSVVSYFYSNEMLFDIQEQGPVHSNDWFLSNPLTFVHIHLPHSHTFKSKRPNYHNTSLPLSDRPKY